MKLKLHHMGEKVTGIGRVTGNVVLGTGIKIVLGALNGGFDTLIGRSQNPPTAIVLFGPNFALEHFPAPLVDQFAKGQKGDFI